MPPQTRVCRGRGLPAVSVAMQKGLSIPGDAQDWPLFGLLWLRRRSSDSWRLSLVRGGRHGLQHVAIDFAQRVAGQFVEYPKTLRDLIGCKPRRDIAEDCGNDRVHRPLSELYETEHALTEHGIRYAHHGSLLDRGMGGDQRLLHFDRRDVGAAANNDVLLAGYEPELISLAAPHQIAGMIPACSQAFLRRFGVVPVAVEDVGPADQEFAGLGLGDISAIFVDQPDLRALCNSYDRPALQAECHRPNDFRCPPDVVERCAKDRGDPLLQIDRADIRAGQTDSQRSQIARPGSLALDQRRILGWETETPRATMAINRVEDR